MIKTLTEANEKLNKIENLSKYAWDQVDKNPTEAKELFKMIYKISKTDDVFSVLSDENQQKEKSVMTKQQQEVINAYKGLLEAVKCLLEQPTQEDFTSYFAQKLPSYVHKFNELEGRGHEQWIYNLKMSDSEYQEVIKVLKDSK